jgi:hypothetical protein
LQELEKVRQGRRLRLLLLLGVLVPQELGRALPRLPRNCRKSSRELALTALHNATMIGTTNVGAAGLEKHRIRVSYR